MKLFHEGGSRIFKNESVLDPSYFPDQLQHRDKELRDLADILKVAAEGRKPENVLIAGPPGTGKTSSVKYVLNQLTDFTKRVHLVYVNCWQASSDTAILSEIVNSLKIAMPRRGLAPDEMADRIFEVLAKQEKIAILVLDEVDRLVAQGGGATLYRFSRSEELGKAKVVLIGITNDTEFIAKVDDRIRSSLAQRRMEFERYKSVELKDILRERVKLAFHPAVVDQDAIALCAAHAARHGGDARIAISLLRAAGLEAEKTDSAKVAVDHVRSVIDRTVVTKAERKISEMSEIEQAVVTALLEGPKTSGQVYKLLEGKATERVVRDYLDRMIKSGIIVAEEIEVKPKGKTRVFRLV